MATCATPGCSTSSSVKVMDWRRRRGAAALAVRLMCDFHGQQLASRPGFSVRGIVERPRAGRGEQRIDLRAALRRLGKLPPVEGKA